MGRGRRRGIVIMCKRAYEIIFLTGHKRELFLSQERQRSRIQLGEEQPVPRYEEVGARCTFKWVYNTIVLRVRSPIFVYSFPLRRIFSLSRKLLINIYNSKM